MTPTLGSTLLLLTVSCLALTCGCAAIDASTPDPAPDTRATVNPPTAADPSAGPPPATRAWMDRLTVPHHWDPKTGFIVADRVTPLPPVLRDAPPLDEQERRASAQGRTLIAFATADRCAPCQQFKLDALNDERVIAELERGGLLVAHIEVDRDPEIANAVLGGTSIPQTYALHDGQVIDVLRGQRSAEELLAFIERVRVER